MSGMPYRDARSAVLRAGLVFVYRDVLTWMPAGDCNWAGPAPGTGAPLNKFVYLYRSFIAPPALVGETCCPLRLLVPFGKLIFWVDRSSSSSTRSAPTSPTA
jgi:hypothetical protein